MVGYEIKNTHTLPRVYDSDKKLLYKLKDDTENIQQQIDDLPDIVLSDWNIEDATNMAFIKNKPNVPILDESGQIPAAYLPSYVDDVIEGYYYNNKFYKESTHTTEITPQEGKIYVDLSTDIAYRWSGSTYVEISKSIVTGVKGNAETNYRIGNINITPTNIGLSNVANLDLSKAIKTITRSGTTFTYTCLDGTTGTFTQQDNNTTYSAGTGLSLTNTTFALALTKKLVTDALGYTPPTTDTTYSAGLGLVLNSTTFKLGSGTIAHYSRTGSGSAYIKIAINSTTTWMLSFKVRLYGSYICDEYIISGYQYGSNHWYSPTVILQNTDGGTRKVIFGYTSVNNLWVAIPDRNYTGCDIIDVVNGYTQVSSFDGLFTLTRIAEADLSTKQSEVTVSPNARKSDIPTSLPASDVYAWAKASTKPSYTLDEVSDGTTRKLTNTWRKVQLNGVDKLGTGTNTNPLNLKAGTNVSITESGGTFTFAATDTTYESKAAASGGTAVSLVTTGEKYTWNNKSNLTIGTTATTAAAGNHTHATSIAASTGTNQLSLAANTKYAITAGGTSYVFTTPADTNTWRGILNNLTSSTNTTESLSAKQGYLLANGDARDNTKLPLAGGTMTGSITMSQPSSARNVGIIGTYDPNKAAAIWAMGASYQIKADGTTMGSLYGACYAYYGSGYTYGAGKSGGHSFVWAQNGNPTVALGNNVWTSGGFIKNGGTSSLFLKADGSVDSNTYLTSHQDISGKKNVLTAVSDPSASGTSLTFIKTISLNAQGVITPAKATVSTMGAASSSAAGTAGLVPAPAKGKQGSFLKGDGTWNDPTLLTNTIANTEYPLIFGSSWTTGNDVQSLRKGIVSTTAANNPLRVCPGANPAANTEGNAYIVLGNNIAKTAANNRTGNIYLYGSTAYWGRLVPTALTGNRTYTLPNNSGTIALTSDIPVAVGTGSVTIISSGSEISANARYYGYVSMGTYADAKKVISISVYTTNRISTTIDGNLSGYIKTSLSHTFVDSVTIGSTTITNAFLFTFGTSNPGATTYMSVYQV